jgi:amino acid transporter
MEKKKMGLIPTISIGVGGMIGAGIFSILGVAAEIAGSKMFISFLIAGVVALLSSYSFAKLGSRYPSSGGPVEFLYKGLGKNSLSGGLSILLWIGYIVAIALYARAFSGYFMTFLPSGSLPILRDLISAGIVLVFMGLNFLSAKSLGRSELIIVGVKVAILVLFISIGIFFVKPSKIGFFSYESPVNILYGAAIVFLAYEGFGLITNAAEDMKNPKKNLPRALYLSVGIVILIYLGISLTVVGNLPVPDIIDAKEYALAEAARPFLGSIGFTLIGIAALFSTSSAINATLYGGANISYTISKEGGLPEGFERKLWKRGREGLVITASIVILLAVILDLGEISMVGSSIFLVIYGAVNVSHLKLLKETGANKYIVIISLITCGVSFGVLAFYMVQYSLITLIVLAIISAVSMIGELVFRWLKTRNGVMNI